MTPIIEVLFLLMAVAKNGGAEDTAERSKAIKNGDTKAFKEFYDLHYSSLYRFMVSRGMSHEETEDLVQRAFIIIWEKRGGIDEEKSLRAYLFQIAYSRMLNHIQYHKKFDNDAEPTDVDISNTSTESDLNYEELLERLKSIVASMPEKRSMVFDLCFMKEFTYKEVAETMNVSVKTVENHMALAFKDVRLALKNLYGEGMENRF